MQSTIQKYLNRRAVHTRWALEGVPRHAPRACIVIPCLAERDTLPHTLNDLAGQTPVQAGQVRVLCVVNHRAHQPDAPDDTAANNAETLAWLRGFQTHGAHWLSIIDAASPGHELPPKAGVGLARKIGLDWALALMQPQPHGGALICLDADTRVPPGYAERIQKFYAVPRWAGLCHYAHPIPEGLLGEAITCYELFLRYHELGLRQAGSPYAFHTIGSTITCTGEAYAAVAGMNQRQAGEDFYFLNELAKTGKVEFIAGPPVVPAARPSWRVPFGTGRRMLRHLAGEQDEFQVYNPETYEVLRRLLHGMQSLLREDPTPEATIARLQDQVPALWGFLEAQGFPESWARIAAQTRGAQRRLQQFHRWFDGFRTLKAAHWLRDNGYPMVDMFQGITHLTGIRGKDALETLEQLRRTADFMKD